MTPAGEPGSGNASRQAGETRVEETGADEASAANARAAGDLAAPDSGRRRGAWRGRLLWAGAIAVAAVGLYIGMLAISSTSPANADGSGDALQGWDMLHGNLLLSGWWTSDVSFYTFEVPIDAIVESFRGLNAEVVNITAAVAYTLLVLVGALLARGKTRGWAGVMAALLTGAILLAPGIGESTGLLLGSPDHIGVAVPIGVTLLVLDRARERWWVPLVVCVLLIWAQLDDPTAEFAAAFALAVVCLVRGALGLLRRTGKGWRYDAALGVAAIVSYGLTRLAVRLIRDAGGFSMRQLQQAEHIQPSSLWPQQLANTWHNTLILFGADYFDQPSNLLTAAAAVHVIGFTLALIGLIVGIVSLLRPGDRVTQALTAGTLVTLGAGVFATVMAPGYDAHEIAVVLPFGAVLAGRTIGPWLARRRLRRITLVPACAALLAAYLGFFGYFATRAPGSPSAQSLADWLEAHHMTSGLGRYWVANSTRLITGGEVRIAPVDPIPQRPYPWITKPSWYDPDLNTANFVVAGVTSTAGWTFSESQVVKVFGKPARVYRFDQYIIMAYNKNLLRQVEKPVQPNPDTGSLHV